MDGEEWDQSDSMNQEGGPLPALYIVHYGNHQSSFSLNMHA
jgi:hypothetical protein